MVDNYTSHELIKEPVLKKGSFCTIIVAPSTNDQTEWDGIEAILAETRNSMIVSYSKETTNLTESICLSSTLNYTKERPSIHLDLSRLEDFIGISTCCIEVTGRDREKYFYLKQVWRQGDSLSNVFQDCKHPLSGQVLKSAYNGLPPYSFFTVDPQTNVTTHDGVEMRFIKLLGKKYGFSPSFYYSPHGVIVNGTIFIGGPNGEVNKLSY